MLTLPSDPQQVWRLVGGATATLNLILAFLVHIRNRQLAYRSFAYLSLALSLWNFCHIQVYPDYSDPAWMRVLFTTLAFIPALARTFAREFLGQARGSPWELRLLYGGGFLILVTVWTPFFDITHWRRAFIFFFFPPLLISLVDFFRALYRAKEPSTKNSLAYLCLASTVAILGGLSEFVDHFGVVLPAFPYASAALMIYTVLMAYAIQTHQLLDIRTVFRRGVIFAALLALSGGGSAAIITLSTRWLGSDIDDLFVPLFLVLVVVMLLWDRWGDRVKELVFREEFRREAMLETWMKSLQGVLGYDEVVRSAQGFLRGQLGVQLCDILIVEKRISSAVAQTQGSLWEGCLHHAAEGVLLAELTDDAKRVGRAHLSPQERRGLADFMEDAGYHLMVPIAQEGRLYGALALGPRLDGFYDPVTRGWLGRISAVLSQVLQALRIHEEMLHSDRLVHLGTVAAGIAHEIRNPLSYLKRALEYFKMQEADPKKRAQMIDSVEQEIGRLSVLVEDILAYANPRPSGKNSCETVSAITELVGILRPSFDAHVRLEWNPPEFSTSAAMDAAQLKQVLLNLVRNAQAALSDLGRPGLITISVGTAEGMVHIQVRDNGPGIPKERMKALFQPFGGGSGKGTGLGLAIVDKLVRVHQGRILVSSSPDHGTQFDVEIPAFANPGVPSR